MGTPVSPTGGKKKMAPRGLVAPNSGTSSRYHRLCGACKHICKQSPKVKIVVCPQFEAKDGN